jgi:SAM-dependent methyltransferase
VPGGRVFGLLRAAWLVLPEPLRRWAPARFVKTRVRGGLAGVGTPGADERPAAGTTGSHQPRVPSDVSTGPTLIGSLAELDEALRKLDAAAAISDDELRRGFGTFEMRFPQDLPADPDSAEYRARQFELYEWLHGKPYAVANEVSQFDATEAADRPFPYHTKSASTVGDQLIAVGYLIRTMDLPAGSRVLEFGPGWGNTTIALARMGCRVTVVDIEPNFLALVNERARRKHLTIETHQGDFSVIARLNRTFDAVLFFECFHHCSQHQSLVAGLDRVVAPGGKVIFAGEPIADDFPVPWGLRPDGESLWSIRRHGWLELGFQERYFRDLLARHGWRVEKSSCAELTGAHTGWGTIFTARRAGGI